MIPKKIHYCWFGNNPKSEKILKCMQSWSIYLSDYEIIEWNEKNFDIENTVYVKQAYEQKKWAFVTDYVRAYALYEHGGIYLDTDVEITGKLDSFLDHGAFSGFELKGYPFTALWGSQKKHHWPKKVLDFYASKNFEGQTNTVYVSDLLVNYYGFDPTNDSIQNFNNDIFIYPSHYFCLNLKNFAIHHFEGSWVPSDLKNEVNNELLNLFIIDNFTKSRSFDEAMDIILKNFKITRFDFLKYALKKIKRKKYFKS
ncbi:glycosyltransferase family 32 protein [Flavobacterium columnare]|uniref:glycosyltransferase family 32 protein n=1 Tax=Flavobacterium columnare TaxID=996 RepID=UPI004033F92A